MIRVHQEDLCQALGVHPSKKYQNEGGPRPAQIVELLRLVMSPRNADRAVVRFVDAMAWNWLIGGTDAHAKNYSLLLADGQVRLAPLYDVASALPYGTHERGLRFAMEIGGDYRLISYQNTWGKAADEMGIDRDTVIGRVHELTSRVADAFAEAASDPDIIALKRNLPNKLVDLIADRAKRCAQQMLAAGRLRHRQEREPGSRCSGQRRRTASRWPRKASSTARCGIHCSVAEAIYGDADDLVVLVIDAARLPSPVRYEGTSGGEQYPHIYGPVPAGAVTDVIPVGRDTAGRLILPEPASPPQAEAEAEAEADAEAERPDRAGAG